MLSKTLFILFCLMIFNCSSMVEALKCSQIKFETVEGTALPKAVDAGEQNCAADEMCVIFAQYSVTSKSMRGYSHVCWRKYQLSMGTPVFVNGDATQECRVTKEVRVACKCETDMCNEYGNGIHKLMLKEFKEKATFELSTVLETGYVPPSAATVDSNAKTPEGPSTEAPKSVNSETEKPQSGGGQETSDKETQTDQGKPAAQTQETDQSQKTNESNSQTDTDPVNNKIAKESDNHDATTPKDSIAGMKPSMIILSFVMMIII